MDQCQTRLTRAQCAVYHIHTLRAHSRPEAAQCIQLVTEEHHFGSGGDGEHLTIRPIYTKPDKVIQIKTHFVHQQHNTALKNYSTFPNLVFPPISRVSLDKNQRENC